MKKEKEKFKICSFENNLKGVPKMIRASNRMQSGKTSV